MNKIFKKFMITILIITVFLLLFYLFALPRIISSPAFIKFVQNSVNKSCNAELTIEKPVLDTSLKPEIAFSVDSLYLKKDNEVLLNLKNFDTKISFYKIFQRKITLDKLGADEIYADVNKLQNLKFKEQKKEKKKGKSFFKITCFNTLFYIKKSEILYVTPKNVKMRLLAKDMEISDKREPKMLHFKIFLDLDHNNEHLRIFFKDKDNVYFKNRKLHADNFKFWVEKSEITINFLLDEKNHYNLSFESDKFEIDNVRRFLNTDILIPNSHEFVSCFKDFTGDFIFKIDMTEKDLNGFLKVNNKIGSKLIPLADIPLNLTDGLLTINSKDIEFKNFKGYYGNNPKNIVNMNGFVKDYSTKTDTEINIDGFVYDEFAKYLSKIAGTKINVVNKTLTEFKVAFNANSKMDILGKINVPIGSDILFEGASISPTKFEREIDINMDLFNNILSMNNIDYHIIDKQNQTGKPLVTINGKVNVLTGILNELGFDIPEPLPTEFFNVLAGQRLFRNGTFAGQMKYINSNTPYLTGEMNMKDTFVVGQGLFIKNMVLKTKNDIVNITTDGSLRRARYKFNADIQNKMVFPVVVKNINLDFDEIDVERVIQTFAPRPQNAQRPATSNSPRMEFAKSNISKEYFNVEEKKNTVPTEDVTVVFQPNLVEINNCVLNVGKGVYKKINFGNLQANLTLSRAGILEIKSNKFDFAQGFSNLKVFCDLAKEKYSINLEANEVDTDAIATSILNLPKEISGKANATIDLNTDSSLKLNGKMKFDINDGSIAKLGFVQYILNMASVFRNPIVMISPTSIVDIVNIPDGSFKKINGIIILKDNSIKSLMIKSSSPQLSSFIVGRINLENMDASLRIYTKFSDKKDGVFGFLRGLSLNTLAKKARTYTKGENVSYYASELEMLPKLETGEDTAQVFVTKFDGDLQSANFISSLKKIK